MKTEKSRTVRPLIVAVGGGTCSGKTTLCNQIEERFSHLNVRVLHMDHYFKKNPPTVTAPFTKKVYPEHNHPDTLELPRLFADCKEAFSGPYDLVLVEGLFALYFPEIYEQSDLSVFVDLRAEERFCRRIRRHMAMGQTFDEITDRYLDTVCLRHDELVEPTKNRADFIISGTFRHRGVDWLCDAIAARLSSRKTREEPT